MAKQSILTGSAPNDGTGDSLLAGATKVNTNFNEIYDIIGDGSSLYVGIVTQITAGSNISVSAAYGGVTINADNQTSNIEGTQIKVSGISTFVGAIDCDGGANISGGESILSSATVSDLTNNRIVIAGTNGALEDDSGLTFNGTELVAESASVSDLTSGRVVIAGTNGSIDDNSKLTFDGNTLNVVGQIEVDDLNVSGVSTFAGKGTFNSEIEVDYSGASSDCHIGGSSTHAFWTSDGKIALYYTGAATFAGSVISGGTLTIPAVSGTNNNASQAVLFQTSAGVVDGGSGLTYNPGTDVLTINGADLGANSFRGSGGLVILSNDNYSSVTQVKVTDKVELFDGGSVKLETTNSGIIITGICTATSFVGSGVSVGNAVFTGICTATSFSGPLTGNVTGNLSGNITGLRTIGTGVTVTAQGIDITGICTATSFVGDGSGLSGVTASGTGVVVQEEGSSVGTAQTINFIGTGVTATFSGGTASVNITSSSSSGINTEHVSSQTLNVVGVSTFAGAVSMTSAALTGTLTFQDNDVIELGNGGDLKLFHNGSYSILRNSNAATPLLLESSGSSVSIQKDTGESMGVFNTDGSVDLYYDNVKKFETTSAGITVAGNTTVGPFVAAAANSNGGQLKADGNLLLNKNGGEAITIYNNSATKTCTIGADGGIIISDSSGNLKASITNAGAATFANIVTPTTSGFVNIGDPDPNDAAATGWSANYTGAVVQKFPTSSTSTALQITTGTDEKVLITASGAATFAGNINTGGNAWAAAANGGIIYANGTTAFSSNQNSEGLWRGYTTGTNTVTSEIFASGAATFKGDVDVHGDLAIGANADISGGRGVFLDNQGTVYAASSPGDYAFAGRTAGISTVTSYITGAGAASFAGINVTSINVTGISTSIISGGVKIVDQLLDKDGHVGAAGSVLSSTGSKVDWIQRQPSIQDLQGTTSSIADDAAAELNITGYKAYSLFKITTNAAAWVRVYVDDASRDADTTRSEGEDPSPGDGVIGEVRTTGSQSVLITPGIMGFNNDNPRTNNIYLSVTNRSGSSTTITVTLTVLQTGE